MSQDIGSLGDSDFNKIDVKALLSDKNISSLAASIKEKKSTNSTDLLRTSEQGHESEETAHISVVDARGLAVASTHTLNGWLGSGVVVPGSGILMNNQMDDFTTVADKGNIFGLVDGSLNLVAGGKRMLSSMSPSFVFRPDGSLYFILGAAGGSK